MSWRSKKQEAPVDVKKPEDLPIFKHRAAILEHIATHRVTHIQGETGCGKSTQVPKYIMEEAEEQKKRGGSGRTKIVVTQPRRMAAITLARRVAEELGEEVGKTVGYKISGDSVSGNMCFATTGFLLQVLVNQPEEFGTYTHVILDEVHERSVDADLLTMLMKLLMQCYPTIKLIVMSATLQAKLFAEYFAALESDHVAGAKVSLRPGGSRIPNQIKLAEPIFVGVRTFPVEEIFLDEIDNHFDIRGGPARQGMDKALRGFSGIGGKGGKGKDKGKKGGKDKGKGGSASGFKRLEPQITEGFDELCRELVQQMAMDSCTLIVFLPGIADITAFYECLMPLDSARTTSRSEGSWRNEFESSAPSATQEGKVALRIYPMHSLIPREEQEEVFNTPPKGVCHVVLASNIAESSLTLPSVCGIIDLAMRRSIQYDARRLMSCLVTTWCSQSSCKQRAGRSGRTMPGRAVRLVPRHFFEEMPAFDPPEMLNAPLTKLYLQAKQLCQKLDNLYNMGVIPDGIEMDLSTPQLLLGEVVQPPSTVLIAAAIRELAQIGCIDKPSEDARITPLGYMAMTLPCELRLCRLLYMGLMLGCPCDAIAMVAGLTAADPFSTPSLLVLKDEKEYCKKLERSFSARRWCDRGRHSEPLMLRDLFAEWIQAGAPRGKSIGGFARDWSIIPKKFEALASESVDLCTRLCKLLNPRSTGYASIQRLLSTMRFTVDRREELMKVEYPSNGDYKKIFSEDVGLMRALICCAFSDQMLLHLKPKWAPSGGKKKKEEQMLEIMKKQDLNISGTVCYLNPPHELRAWDAEENHQLLAIAMCGERAVKVHFDEREKLLFFDFKGKPSGKGKKGSRMESAEEEVEDGFDPCPVIQDVCAQAHRLHQFGAGRYKFNVESPIELSSGGGWGGDDSDPYNRHTLELFKPMQPFLISWEVLQHASQSGKGQGKKSSAIKAMPDWRNPMGFACNARADLPAEELIGVCASVQGLESGGSAFVAGASALGLNYMPLLLCTLDPEKWDIQWGFNEAEEVVSVKICNNEIVLPPETLTADIIWKINAVRSKIRESLTPWSPADTVPDVRIRRGINHNSAGNAYIWVSDASQEFGDLLEEIWPTPDPVTKPKKIYYCSASGWAEDQAEEDSDILTPLYPLAEEADWDSMNVKEPQQQSSGKKKKGAASASEAGGLASRPNVSKNDMKAIKGVLNYLGGKSPPQDKLSAICGRYQTTKKLLGKFGDVFSVTQLDGNEWMVRVIGNHGAEAGGGKGKGKGGKAGGKGASSKGGGGKGGGGNKSNAAIDAGIDALCRVRDVACQGVDFDSRVRTWFVRFQRRRGQQALENAFELLGEWCAKKERSQVRSWPSYLMVLLRNWERNEFEGGSDGD